MIDTYMDRADAATGYRRPPPSYIDPDDDRYYRGGLYATVIDRMVAEALDRLQQALHISVQRHKIAIRAGAQA